MFGRKKKDSDPSTQGDKKDKKSKSIANKPLLLAALAGLIAIAGALLLVWRFQIDKQDVVSEIVASNEATVQVVTVSEPIRAGTSVDQILDNPTSFVAIKTYPESSVPPNVFFSIEELEAYRGLTSTVDLVPGEQLLKDRFDDPSNFSQEAFIARSSVVKPPPGHHTMVLSLLAERALGGNVRAGDKVAIIGSFTYQTEEQLTDVSLIVLPEVEVVQVQATEAGAGQLGTQVDDVGVASVATYVLTVAVTPEELGDLTYALEYGQIRLAGALEGSSPDDDRPFSTIETILGGAIDPKTNETFDIGEGSESAEFEVGKNAEDREEGEGSQEGEASAEGEGSEEGGDK